MYLGFWVSGSATGNDGFLSLKLLSNLFSVINRNAQLLQSLGISYSFYCVIAVFFTIQRLKTCITWTLLTRGEYV